MITYRKCTSFNVKNAFMSSGLQRRTHQCNRSTDQACKVEVLCWRIRPLLTGQWTAINWLHELFPAPEINVATTEEKNLETGFAEMEQENWTAPQNDRRVRRGLFPSCAPALKWSHSFRVNWTLSGAYSVGKLLIIILVSSLWNDLLSVVKTWHSVF